MNVIQNKIYGFDSLDGIGKNEAETECVPLIILHDRYGSLIPGYTLKKYWDRKEEAVTNVNTYLESYTTEENINDDIIPVIVPFPQKKVPSPRNLINVRRSMLAYQDPVVDYLNKDNIKEISKFDFSRMDNILEHTKIYGVLTLILTEPEKICDLLRGFKHDIIGKFKYCVVYYCNDGKTSTSKKSSPLLHLTFMNLNACIPVFDGGKTDGVGILCEYMLKYENEENYSTTGQGMAIALSNNAENVITVDGTVIGKHGTLGRDFIDRMIKISTVKTEPKESMYESGMCVSDPDDLKLCTTYGTSSGYYTVSTSANVRYNNY